MNHAAAQMNGVFGKSACNECVLLFDAHVCKLEQRQRELQQCGTHFDGRMAGFGIDIACMGYADRHIDIAHDFGKDNIGHIVDFDRLSRSAVGKLYPFEGG